MYMYICSFCFILFPSAAIYCSFVIVEKTIKAAYEKIPTDLSIRHAGQFVIPKYS